MRKSIELQEFVFTSVILIGRLEEEFTERAIETFFKLVMPTNILLKRVPDAIKGGLPAVVSSLEDVLGSDQATSSCVP